EAKCFCYTETASAGRLHSLQCLMAAASARKTRMVRRFLILLLLVLSASVAFAAEDFYEQQLRAGKIDFQNNRLPEAADELRIAAFGLLNRPALLEEALIR